MKRRYVAIAPQAGWFQDCYNDEMARNLTVYETEEKPTPTGLVDRHGIPLYATNEREKIGFKLTPKQEP